VRTCEDSEVWGSQRKGEGVRSKKVWCEVRWCVVRRERCGAVREKVRVRGARRGENVQGFRGEVCKELEEGRACEDSD